MRQVRSGRRLCEQSLQVIERHVRIGGAGQQAAKPRYERFKRSGTEIRLQRGEIPPASVRIANGFENLFIRHGCHDTMLS
jgi:hypothetical protein